jgi:CRP-like cAMP-binding protein
LISFNGLSHSHIESCKNCTFPSHLLDAYSLGKHLIVKPGTLKGRREEVSNPNLSIMSASPGGLRKQVLLRAEIEIDSNKPCNWDGSPVMPKRSVLKPRDSASMHSPSVGPRSSGLRTPLARRDLLPSSKSTPTHKKDQLEQEDENDEKHANGAFTDNDFIKAVPQLHDSESVSRSTTHSHHREIRSQVFDMANLTMTDLEDGLPGGMFARRGSLGSLYELRDSLSSAQPLDSFLPRKHMRHAPVLPKDPALKDEHKVETIYAYDHDKKWYIIMPNKRGRAVWDMCIAVFVLYLSFKLPLSLAFPVDEFSDDGFLAVDIFLDVFFWMDIISNFFTGYYHNGKIELDHRMIAHHYLHGWFTLDLIASFPFEYMLGSESKSQRKALKISKILKLSKLLRIGRLIKYMRAYFKWRHLITLVMAVTLVSHWLTCVWFMAEIDHDDTRWSLLESGVSNLGSVYLEVFNDVMLQMSGSSAIRPSDANTLSDAVSLVSILVTIMGFVLQVFAIAVVTSVMMMFQGPRERFRQKMALINEEMIELNLSNELQTSIKQYYDYLWLNKKSSVYDRTESLLFDQDLSSSLKKKVSKELTHGYYPIALIPAFSMCSDDVLMELLLRMKTHVFMPGDSIVTQGEVGKEMFIILKGECEVTIEGVEGVDITMTAGDFFGEIALVTESKRTASISASTSVEVSVLTKDEVDDVILLYPEYGHILEKLAKDRLDNDKQVHNREQHGPKPKQNFQASVEHRMHKLERSSHKISEQLNGIFGMLKHHRPDEQTLERGHIGPVKRPSLSSKKILLPEILSPEILSPAAFDVHLQSEIIESKK